MGNSPYPTEPPNATPPRVCLTSLSRPDSSVVFPDPTRPTIASRAPAMSVSSDIAIGHPPRGICNWTLRKRKTLDSVTSSRVTDVLLEPAVTRPPELFKTGLDPVPPSFVSFSSFDLDLELVPLPTRGLSYSKSASTSMANCASSRTVQSEGRSSAWQCQNV